MMIGCFVTIIAGSVTAVDDLLIVVGGLTSVMADLALVIGGLVNDMNGLVTLVAAPKDSFDWMRLRFDLMLLFELSFPNLATTDSLSHIVYKSPQLLTPSPATILLSEESAKLSSCFVVTRIVATAFLISYFMFLLALITFDMLDNSW